jgi:hypothetical protein
MELDQDGLIGADVFSSYVVDIDIPGGRVAPVASAGTARRAEVGFTESAMIC